MKIINQKFELIRNTESFILLIIWIILIPRTFLYGLVFRPLGFLILATMNVKTQSREALFWHLACSKIIKNQWLEISPFLRHHSTYCHFLIVLKILESKNLPCWGTWCCVPQALAAFSPGPFCCLSACCPVVPESDTHQAHFQWREKPLSNSGLL